VRRTGAAPESSGHGDTSFLVVPDRYERSLSVFAIRTVEGAGVGVNVVIP
jgi:hypothetical protein